jgi:dihydroorotate dehydrogenase
MSLIELLAKSEFALRTASSIMPPSLVVRAFTAGRNIFLPRFAQDVTAVSFVPPSDQGVTAWGLQFRFPLWNAAGMFKKGYGYDVVAAQGAGAFVAGTTTSRARAGNVVRGIAWPSTQYPNSHSASNWMGLPNEGHTAVASRLSKVVKVPGCPLGASVSAEPGLDAAQAIPELIEGMQRYADAGVDYLELNESCPNVPGHGGGHAALDEGLLSRLDAVAQSFLVKRTRTLPVVVKLSTDTSLEQLPALLSALIERGFDGVILGNTSTRYAELREHVHHDDRKLYDYFTSTYGGGISGQLLRTSSLLSSATAVRAVQEINPSHEFNVIRCGGVMTADDVTASMVEGVRLNQWYVGYFEGFAQHGHKLYREMSACIRPTRARTES